MGKRVVHYFKNLETDKIIHLVDNSKQYTNFINNQSMWTWWYLGSK